MRMEARRSSKDSLDSGEWVVVDGQGRDEADLPSFARRDQTCAGGEKLDEQLMKECAQLKDYYDQMMRIVIELRHRFEAARDTNALFKYGHLKGMIHEAIVRSKPVLEEQMASLALVTKAGKRKENYFKSGYLSTGESERAYQLFAEKKRYRAQLVPLRKVLAQLELDYEDSKDYLPHVRFDYMKFMIKKVIYASCLPAIEDID